MSRWDRYVLRPRVWAETSGSETVPHIGPYTWYDTLRDFLICKGFKSGSLDPTLFTKYYDDALFICQIYVYDIIFGCTNKKYSEEFAFLMSEQYQMSMMGELKFFLGLQIR